MGFAAGGCGSSMIGGIGAILLVAAIVVATVLIDKKIKK